MSIIVATSFLGETQMTKFSQILVVAACSWYLSTSLWNNMHPRERCHDGVVYFANSMTPKYFHRHDGTTVIETCKK